jgi:hypothetical protein
MEDTNVKEVVEKWVDGDFGDTITLVQLKDDRFRMIYRDTDAQENIEVRFHEQPEPLIELVRQIVKRGAWECVSDR